MNLRDPSTVVLVACSAKKVQSACQARFLYIGDLFLRSKLLVERSGAAWAILSAKHGVLHPTQVVVPYDQRLSNGARRRAEWERRVRDQLHAYPTGTHFVLLCGADYRRALEPTPLQRGLLGVHIHKDLAAYTCEAPMAGLGIGHQKQWLARELEAVAA